jgi:hypothetical protein
VRTTLTLDDDVRAKLEQEMRRHGKTFKELVNHYLRLGLNARRAAKPARRFVVRPRPMGLREGLSLESIPKLLEQLEGPLHR